MQDETISIGEIKNSEWWCVSIPIHELFYFFLRAMLIYALNYNINHAENMYSLMVKLLRLSIGMKIKCEKGLICMHMFSFNFFCSKVHF